MKIIYYLFIILILSSCLVDTNEEKTIDDFTISEKQYVGVVNLHITRHDGERVLIHLDSIPENISIYNGPQLIIKNETSSNDEKTLKTIRIVRNDTIFNSLDISLPEINLVNLSFSISRPPTEIDSGTVEVNFHTTQSITTYDSRILSTSQEQQPVSNTDNNSISVRSSIGNYKSIPSKIELNETLLQNYNQTTSNITGQVVEKIDNIYSDNNGVTVKFSDFQDKSFNISPTP